MAEQSEQLGEKTEQATPKRLEESLAKGQFPRSAEVQTVFILFGGVLALLFAGRDAWNGLGQLIYGSLAHLHETEVTMSGTPRYLMDKLAAAGAAIWPLLAASALGGALAIGVQCRFRTASEALGLKWDRLSPVNGFKRIFSLRSLVPTGIAMLKLSVILAFSYGVIAGILRDPIFYSSVDVIRVGAFLSESSMKILMRIGFALMVVAALDYAYQFWRTNKDMMMTKTEVKDELKSQEGDPKLKARMKTRRQTASQRRMLIDVPKADVVVTNPTHLAIALRYDRKTMAAPRIVAKGSRLHALKIREIASQHQIPIIENKPLARLMFKHGRVGGEIPAQLYAAVAEILSYVYRTNAYRYYREQHLN
jgi:flagellar biosynthetic protein FlhB